MSDISTKARKPRHGLLGNALDAINVCETERITSDKFIFPETNFIEI